MEARAKAQALCALGKGKWLLWEVMTCDVSSFALASIKLHRNARNASASASGRKDEKRMPSIVSSISHSSNSSNRLLAYRTFPLGTSSTTRPRLALFCSASALLQDSAAGATADGTDPPPALLPRSFLTCASTASRTYNNAQQFEVKRNGCPVPVSSFSRAPTQGWKRGD
jgi:hypothetical protein